MTITLWFIFLQLPASNYNFPFQRVHRLHVLPSANQYLLHIPVLVDWARLGKKKKSRDDFNFVFMPSYPIMISKMHQ